MLDLPKFAMEKRPEKRRDDRFSLGTLLVLRLKPKDVRRESVDLRVLVGMSLSFGMGPVMLVGGCDLSFFWSFSCSPED